MSRTFPSIPGSNAMCVPVERDVVLCCTHLGVAFGSQGEQAQSRLHFAYMLIGLTGGIGCGKSSAATLFAAQGFRVLDTDKIVREQVLTSPAVLDEARARWGGTVLTADGRGINRARVGEIVFAQANERAWWEGIVHPRVGAIWRAPVAANLNLDWVVEVPLLFEAKLEKGFDFVVCVGANRNTQLARVIARGTTPAQAELRIASQLILDTKFNHSHIVLWNEGSLDFLRAQVEACAKCLHQSRI